MGSKNETVRMGHLILDGTPAEEEDPRKVITYAQCDVSYTDYCIVARDE